MNELGLRVHLEQVDLLFDGFDPDDSGSISLEELNGLLKRNANELDLSPLQRRPAAPATGITALRRQLEAKKAECAQLEAAHAEHEAANRACDTLEREMSELRKQACIKLSPQPSGHAPNCLFNPRAHTRFAPPR